MATYPVTPGCREVGTWKVVESYISAFDAVGLFFAFFRCDTMVGGSLKLGLVLAALGSSMVAADVFPRQTTFSNATASSTATSTASGVPTLPPCCWLLAGDKAVGLNKWYSSTADHVVGELHLFLSRQRKDVSMWRPSY